MGVGEGGGEVIVLVGILVLDGIVVPGMKGVLPLHAESSKSRTNAIPVSNIIFLANMMARLYTSYALKKQSDRPQNWLSICQGEDKIRAGVDVYHRFFRSFLCLIMRLLFFLLTRVVVVGKENIPEKGGYLVAANHLSMIEVPLVYCMIKRDDVSGLVARKHYKNPFFRWIVNGLGGIWLSRDEIDTRALRDARDHMKNGGILGIAPEGTRSQTGALISPKTGVAFLADQARVPILPVAVSGTWQITRQVFTLQRPIIQVNFGEPFTIPPIDRKNRDEDLRKNTEEIMCHIAALLPPEHRGIYADHPRVLELLAAQ